ncbi:DUF1707 domain-containing protein [Nonomuraea spiralis]|uniref:DUF1707 domain-containing protein n=1 Tax=Nonomuraea spiralis TaxID=46182 RepID=A0ABV5II85_9ACTN|nr:DUF1707 domain-containing protein [Nonomuraea spiralis]GGS98940.1 hypothetical protein GCM10010176_048680 [Nonomuraea spiralis]
MTDDAGIRAGDHDRDQVAARLRQAVAEGRISLEELHDRIDRTYAARTVGELGALVADLPPVSSGLVPVSDVLTMHTEHWRVRRDGRWVVPPRIDVRLGVWGTAKLDFRAAECLHREVLVHVRITSWFGDLHLKVPHGWHVRADELVSPGLGQLHDKPVEPPSDDGVVLRLTGHSRGDIWVRYRHPLPSDL